MKKNGFFVLCLAVALILCFSSTTFAGGTVLYAASGEPLRLDPGDITEGHSAAITENIFECLLSKKRGTFEIEPGLAESWEVSQDGLEIIFHLRKGVKFHDGTDFKADAVVFSWARQYDTKHPFHKYGEWAYWNYINSDIKEAVKIDDYTVKALLKRPNATILLNIAFATTNILSPANAEKYKENAYKHPCGTGPFKFVEWVKDDHVTLAANENYWQGRPRLDRVIFKVIPDPSARLMAVEVGEAHIMEMPNPADLTRAKKNKDLKIMQKPGTNIGYLAMNTGFGYIDANKNGRRDGDEPLQKTPGYTEPLTNKKVRKAINMAIDKTAIAKHIYKDAAVPAKNGMPPQILGYNDSVTDYPYDPARAKKLLAEAGYPNGFSSTLWVMPVSRPYMFDPPKIAEAIQGYLEAVNITVDLYQTDWATYLQKTENGEHPMCLMGWTGDNGDPDNFLNSVYGPDKATIGSAGNRAFYQNEEYQDLLNKAVAIYDAGKRAEYYRKAQEILNDDAGWVFLVHATQLKIMRKEVQGFILEPLAQPLFSSVYLDQ